MPLLRDRSRDASRWGAWPLCLPFHAVHVWGRLDDMLTVGTVHLCGHVVAQAVADLPGGSRIALEIDRVGLTDRLTVRLAGEGAQEEDVRRTLWAIYPIPRVNEGNGSLLLSIEADANLGGQFKDPRIVDRHPQAEALPAA